MDQQVLVSTGATMRDLYAMAALQGMLAKEGVLDQARVQKPHRTTAKIYAGLVAGHAFAIADAMLIERAKR